MKILHIISGLGTGGAERSLNNLLDGGLAQWADNRVVSLTDEGTFGAFIASHGIHVSTLRLKSPENLIHSPWRLRVIVREFSPDIIQGWMYHGNIAAWLTRKFFSPKSRLFWNIRHSLDDLSNEKQLLQWVIRINTKLSASADGIIYNSHRSFTQHSEMGLIGKSHCIIPNGFDTTLWKRSDQIRSAVRGGLEIPDDAVVFGHVARFHPMKNHEMFMSLAVELAETHDEIHFIMAGKGVTEEKFAAWSGAPEEVRNRIHVLGEHTNIPMLMSAFDVLCVTSSYGEAFPNVLGEAMSSSIPCVTTDVGDSAMIIGDTGRVIPPGSKSGLGEAMDYFIQMDSEERISLGERARKRISDKFSLGNTVGSYLELYEGRYPNST